MDAPEIEQLIGEVARRHHLLLGRDDPLLISITLHELLLDRHLARLELALETAQRQIAASSAQQTDLARDGAAKLITAAAAYADQEIKAAAGNAAAELTSAVQAQLAPFRMGPAKPPQPILWSVIGAAAGMLAAASILYLLWGQGPNCELLPVAADQLRAQQR